MKNIIYLAIICLTFSSCSSETEKNSESIGKSKAEITELKEKGEQTVGRIIGVKETDTNGSMSYLMNYEFQTSSGSLRMEEIKISKDTYELISSEDLLGTSFVCYATDSDSYLDLNAPVDQKPETHEDLVVKTLGSGEKKYVYKANEMYEMGFDSVNIIFNAPENLLIKEHAVNDDLSLIKLEYFGRSVTYMGILRSISLTETDEQIAEIYNNHISHSFGDLSPETTFDSLGMEKNVIDGRQTSIHISTGVEDTAKGLVFMHHIFFLPLQQKEGYPNHSLVFESVTNTPKEEWNTNIYEYERRFLDMLSVYKAEPYEPLYNH